MNSRVIAWIMSILAAILGVACVLIYQRYSPNRAFVRVGSKTISQSDFKGSMEYYSGKQILTKMVYEELISQAAKKSNVTATEAEIDDRIKQIERRNPKQVEAAQTDSIKMSELRNDLRTNISMENLQTKDVNVTDAEIAAFYNKNKAAFAVPTQTQAQIVMTKELLQAQQAKSMLEQSLKPDVIAQKRGLMVVGINGFNPDWSRLEPANSKRLTDLVSSLPVGKAGILAIGSGKSQEYIVVKTIKMAKAAIPSLAEIKPLVTHALKLSKAPPSAAVLKDLYDKANVTFENSKYESYFYDLKQVQIPEKKGDKISAMSTPATN